MLDFRRLASKDLLQKVVQDIAVRAGKHFDKTEYIFRPRIESAAICKPAIHPSVRSSSAADRPGIQTEKPMTSSRNWAVSATVKPARRHAFQPSGRAHVGGR